MGKTWRKASEAFKPELAGDDDYGKQVPLARAIPLWGGCSGKGFSTVLFHETKKLSVGEWCAAVKAGKLKAAITRLKPVKAAGPWWALCDNECFLRAAKSAEAHKQAGVKLWRIPPKSPDLNPVEKFWSWLRRKLRAMDLADAVAKRPSLGKQEYKARVQGVLKSRKAQQVAANCATSFKKTCREVAQRKGAGSKG